LVQRYQPIAGVESILRHVDNGETTFRQIFGTSVTKYTASHRKRQQPSVHTDIADSAGPRACLDTSEIIEIIRPYWECNHFKPVAVIKV
jgi:hypothetical protein